MSGKLPLSVACALWSFLAAAAHADPWGSPGGGVPGGGAPGLPGPGYRPPAGPDGYGGGPGGQLGDSRDGRWAGGAPAQPYGPASTPQYGPGGPAGYPGGSYAPPYGGMGVGGGYGGGANGSYGGYGSGAGCYGCSYSGNYYGSNVTARRPAPPPRIQGQWRNGWWYY